MASNSRFVKDNLGVLITGLEKIQNKMLRVGAKVEAGLIEDGALKSYEKAKEEHDSISDKEMSFEKTAKIVYTLNFEYGRDFLENFKNLSKKRYENFATDYSKYLLSEILKDKRMTKLGMTSKKIFIDKEGNEVEFSDFYREVMDNLSMDWSNSMLGFPYKPLDKKWVKQKKKVNSSYDENSTYQLHGILPMLFDFKVIRDEE